MDKHVFFVTGTDTDVGKTTISVALLQAAKLRGLKTLGLKPVAAGCERYPEGLRNEDALALQYIATENISYQQCNPIALQDAIAPHIAAEREGVALASAQLAMHCRQVLRQTSANFCIVEGVGGWLVPLNADETMADLAVQLEANVVLVVGIKLGCLNHALLTTAAIQQCGLRLAGWIANCSDANTQAIDENVATLQQRIAAPCLAVVPFQPTVIKSQDYSAIASHLTIEPLLALV